MTALQREWYTKLKASGFEDIETGDEHSGLLKTDKRIEPERALEYAASAEYYQRAGQFLHSKRWASPVERRIWELHADGVGMNEIARTVKKGNTQVHALINRLRSEMLGISGMSGMGAKNDTGNERAFWRWLEKQAQRLSDEDLMGMAPTLLEIARPSSPTRRRS